MDGIPTVMNIELQDVQSRDVSEWKVEAVRYAHEKLERQVLSPGGLGTLDKHALWQQLGANNKHDELD